jgi:hypothetical protein
MRVYTHSLATLADRTELKADLESRQQLDPTFATNWEIVKDWNEDSRYEIVSNIDARELFEALSSDPTGVPPWIRTQ